MEAWSLWILSILAGTIRQKWSLISSCTRRYRLSWDQKRYFLENMVGTFGEVLRDRIRIVYPLHGGCLGTRLLNEFVPEHASRREFAFQGADDGRLNIEEQLQKARRMMHQIRRDYPEILQ